MTTVAPASQKTFAQAAPMPLAPPVIRTTPSKLPASLREQVVFVDVRLLLLLELLDLRDSGHVVGGELDRRRSSAGVGDDIDHRGLAAFSCALKSWADSLRTLDVFPMAAERFRH